VVLVLKRREGYPKTDEELNARAAEVAGSVRRRLALEAVARGYIRCEYFDDEGKFIADWEMRVTDLAEKESIKVKLPLPRRTRLTRVILTW
jgi:hypothetical protein